MADIYLSPKNRSRVYRLPFLPGEFPEVTRAANNEEFATYQDGVYNIPGDAGLREIPLEGVLPCKRYGFAKSGVRAREVISLLEDSMKRKKPIRVVLSAGWQTSMLATVENLSWHFDRAGDIMYSAGLKEYRNV